MILAPNNSVAVIEDGDKLQRDEGDTCEPPANICRLSPEFATSLASRVSKKQNFVMFAIFESSARLAGS